MPIGPQDDTGGATVTLRREYPVALGDAWAALTESDRLAGWIGTWTGPDGTPDVTADGTQPQRVEFTMTGEVDAGGAVADPVTVTVVACEPPGAGIDPVGARLVVDIPDPSGGPDLEWRVAVTVRAQGDGTELRFAQRVADGVDPAAVEAGWSWYLDRLGAVLTGGPMPEWAEYAPAR